LSTHYVLGIDDATILICISALKGMQSPREVVNYKTVYMLP
jgi:hypothetical protein